jgi:hypothetical protein
MLENYTSGEKNKRKPKKANGAADGFHRNQHAKLVVDQIDPLPLRQGEKNTPENCTLKKEQEAT